MYYLKIYETFEPEEEWEEEEISYHQLKDNELIIGEIYTVIDEDDMFMIGRLISISKYNLHFREGVGDYIYYSNFIKKGSYLTNKIWFYGYNSAMNGIRYIRNSTIKEREWFLECEKEGKFIPKPLLQDMIVKRIAESFNPQEEWDDMYDKSIRIPWGERDNYREATIQDLFNGRSMKLKKETTNRIYRYTNGHIEKYNRKKNEWEKTFLIPITKSFCVKK